MTSQDLLYSQSIENRPESKSFIRTALAWKGSVSPRVLPRVAVAAIYSAFVAALFAFYPNVSLPITPFEYSGAVLGLLLVLRVNSGIDRWWEARKIWGSIVNQSRNLALVGYGYSKHAGELSREFLRWVAIWPSVMRESLRGERQLSEVIHSLGKNAAEEILNAKHMPTFVGYKITQLLVQLRDCGLDSFAFQRAEAERSQLIDAIGACERIKGTRMPLVLAIKTRRFILFFLALLPFALADRLGILTPIVVCLVAYPLFALDEIGAELQNPFSPRNLSHLPLDSICKTISENVLSLQNCKSANTEQVEHTYPNVNISRQTLSSRISFV